MVVKLEMRVKRAIIYTRVSHDKSGRARSVEEQEADCRLACERFGWVVAMVLQDNDAGASRWSKKKRPAYDDLAKILQPGDVLVTWEASRAQRDRRAYFALSELCAERGVLWCYKGRVFDLNDTQDRFLTLLDLGLAEKEVDETRDRVMRTLNSNAAKGLAHGRLPYGYTAERNPKSGEIIERILDPVEAPIVREMADRVLAGESLRSIAKDLNERGLPTPQSRDNRKVPVKGVWLPTVINRLLMKPTIAGLRTHHDKVVAKGDWPAIITEDEFERLKAILEDPLNVNPRGSAPKHLLSGIAMCGVCGARCYRKKRSYGDAYQCTGDLCVLRKVEVVDAHVMEWVYAMLKDERARERLSQTDDSDAVAARQRIVALRNRLEEYTEEAMAGGISATAFGKIEQRWREEIVELETVAHQSVAFPKLQKLLGRGDARQTWEGLGIEEQREIIRATLNVTINRSTDPKPIDISWRGATDS